MDDVKQLGEHSDEVYDAIEGMLEQLEQMNHRLQFGSTEDQKMSILTTAVLSNLKLTRTVMRQTFCQEQRLGTTIEILEELVETIKSSIDKESKTM